ncbi:hypothetical protein [Streptomyces sp. NPDC101776]|uniref:hypothetical protein n=1 Tax=Streptomyces sp. NPDC101776 TaxID=3366146 RepID=UPI0037F8CECF
MPEWWQGFTAGVLLTLLIWQASASIRRTNARIRELGADTAYNFEQVRKKRPDLFNKKRRTGRSVERSEQGKKKTSVPNRGNRGNPEAITRAMARLDREGIDWRAEQPPNEGH